MFYWLCLVPSSSAGDSITKPDETGDKHPCDMILTAHKQPFSCRSWAVPAAGKAEKQVKTSQAKHIFKAKYLKKKFMILLEDARIFSK